MKINCIALFQLSTLLLFQSAAFADTKIALTSLEKQGKYIITLAGCNDCHTSGYARRSGRIKLQNWLTGNNIGFKGPWGVTYASNLRLYFSDLTEKQWLQRAKQLKTRPPMPWFVIRTMTDQDLRSIYAFMQRLGKKGQPVPPFTPRGTPAKTSFIDFMPQSPPENDEINTDD